jgi:lipopolysaccharide assembly outer membrane protein LptD (OstA)
VPSTSEWGEYSPATKLAVFNHEVKLVNPKFVLTSDTLKYSTESKIATILGPSDIVSDKNHIYSERGEYNTVSEQAELLDRSILTNEGRKRLILLLQRFVLLPLSKKAKC